MGPSSPIQDADRNIYGTTETGGAVGYGTVFEVDVNGTEGVLHSSSGPGSDPEPSLLLGHNAEFKAYRTTTLF